MDGRTEECMKGWADPISYALLADTGRPNSQL